LTAARVDRKDCIVWSSINGDLYYGTVVSHLVLKGTDHTLCGRPKGRMTTRYTTFNPERDCKLCARKSTK
jgi:hypothetical protein